jgi:hypothetical protein
MTKTVKLQESLQQSKGKELIKQARQEVTDKSLKQKVLAFI